ncbi:carbohydrate-binding module family 14 protein [Aspergillus clavatus NRRL 1]|uniref:Chitin binding Peritrophin-A domain protein n=1 Tax=Aspergillus clavatus (strain ATCC 1007 / CBS 513.65 / DSM 816 / NCTC 3887 / NRRL 1 / QM 1276 / 107) TaxID=344612 RepID=A1C5Q9_ASPCL|nr:chitin binding Peritrophin-A domain protein [Aspergillus clavatus NRRL 1]EAW15027.1 chitin binding Peritrophin-A domain protein [Aspergillus clavatus NRRL 1]
MQFTYKALSALAVSFFFSTASAVAHCKPGQAWPDVHDCHNFFECASGGVPVLKTCGPGTAYCPKTGICDYEFKNPACRLHGAGPEGHAGPGGHDGKGPEGHGGPGGIEEFAGHGRPDGPAGPGAINH